MKNALLLFPILLTLLFLTALNPAVAQTKKLVVNQQELDCDVEGIAAVNSDGNIEIEVQDSACLGGFGVSSLLLQPPVAAPGEEFFAVWASTGAETCELEMPVGWTEPNIGLEGAISLEVPAGTTPGDYTINLICSDPSGEIESASAILDVQESLPDDPPSAPQLVREVVEPVAPGTIQLTWSSSIGAADCEAESTPVLAGWDGSVGTGQDQEVVLTDLAAGSYTFALRCSNAAGDSPWEAVSATVASSTQCANRQPPSGWARMGAAGTGTCYWNSGWQGNDCTIWEGGISSTPFHQETGTSHRLAYAGRPDAEQYLAIELDTTGMSTAATGRLQTSSSDPFAASVSGIVTISSCPGDFHKTEVMQETGCYSRGLFSLGLEYGGTTTGRGCQLESNRTYYLNIIPTISSDGTEPDLIAPHPNCEEGPCGKVTAWQ